MGPTDSYRGGRLIVTQPEALDLCSLIADDCERVGFVVALFGSCLKHTGGRDIDLVMLPKGPWAHADRIDGVLQTRGFRRVTEYTGIAASARQYVHERDELLPVVLDVRFMPYAERLM